MSKGALLFQSEDLLILVQKSRLQIFQIENGNIFSESEWFFIIKGELEAFKLRKFYRYLSWIIVMQS